MKDVFVPTNNYNRLQGLVDEVARSSLGIEMVAVVGPSGRGKTRAAERIVVKTRESVFIRHQEWLTPIGVIRELAFALAGMRPRSTAACVDLIKTELASSRRVILVDEADRMSIRHLNALRDFHDMVKVPVILIGEEPLITKLNAERRLIRRARHVLRFDPVSQSDVRVFFNSALGIGLTDRQCSQVAQRAEGDFRMVVNLAAAAERFMTASERREITDSMILELCGDGGNGAGGGGHA